MEKSLEWFLRQQGVPEDVIDRMKMESPSKQEYMTNVVAYATEIFHVISLNVVFCNHLVMQIS